MTDARPLEYPESGSDGEEERMSEPLGGEDSSFDGSPGETSESGALKHARDDVEPESAKHLRDDGLSVPENVGDKLRDGDCVLSSGHGGANGLPSPVASAVASLASHIVGRNHPDEG